MTGRDERLLVGGGHDLARLQRGQHRPQAHHTAGGHDDEVDVLPGGHLRERVGSIQPGGASREVEALGRIRVGHRDDPRLQSRSLFGDGLDIAARGDGHDLEVTGLAGGEHLHRLATDGASGAQERDTRASALPRRSRHQAPMMSR